MAKLRRSLLYMPADNKKMLAKAQVVRCDAVIFDLEDAVSTENKARARDTLAAAAIWEGEATKQRIIRVNDVDTPYFTEDMALVARLLPDAIILPKAVPQAVRRAAAVLDAAKGTGAVAIIPLIESALGVCTMAEICMASPRVTALQFGAEDYTRDMEIARTKAGVEVAVAKTWMAVVCKAYGVEAIDTPYVDFKDEAGLRAECMAARNMGFTAKTCIHPAQCAAVNAAFSPFGAEIENAKRILAAAALPENKGRGAFPLEGKMVDAPVLARAERILEKAALMAGQP